MGEKARKIRNSRMRKQMVGCVQAVEVNKKFLVQFKYMQKIEMGSCLLTSICSEEEVDNNINKTIFDLSQKEGELLTIDVNSIDEEEFMFEQDMYFYVFHCLYVVNELLSDILEYQSREQIDYDPEFEDDILFGGNRVKYYKDVIVENNGDKGDHHSLSGRYTLNISSS